MKEPSPYLISRNGFGPGESTIYDGEYRKLEPQPTLSANLQRYWRTFRKHTILIIAAPVVFCALMFVRDLMATPIYTATATLLIKTKVPQVINTEENQDNDRNASDASSQMTEYELLKSPSLAERVIREQKLSRAPATSQSQGRLARIQRRIAGKIENWIGSLNGSKYHEANVQLNSRFPANEDRVVRKAVDGYLANLKVTPVEGTELVKVSIVSSDPQMAAKLANAHALEFIAWGVEISAQTSDRAEKFLEEKLADLRIQLEASEAAVNDYRKANGIIPGLISSDDGKTGLILARLDKLSEEAQEAHLKTISLQTELSTAASGKPEAIQSVASNQAIQTLKQKLDEFKAEYATLQGKFTPDYPKMVQLRAAIEGTSQALKDEIEGAIAATRAQYHEAVKREKAIEDELDRQKSFALGLNNVAVRYGILERDADTNRQLYNAVLKRMKDLTLVADLHASNVSVVDQATPPLSPSSPKNLLDFEIALIVGLLAGIGAAFVLEQLADTFDDGDETERFLGTPLLALIPDASSDQSVAYGSSAPQLPHNASNGKVREVKVPAVYKNGPVLGEEYRTLRTSLQLSRAGSHPRTILITGALPREGKTTIAINTATVFAHTGSRVLLIDADLRKPRCHIVFGTSHYPGLTEVLIGARDLESAVQGTLVNNLYLLSSGQRPPNPSELLGSEKMKELLQKAVEQYDYVLLDSPPVAVVSDGLLLATLVDGVVVVVRAGHTPKQLVKSLLARFEYARARVFGVTLNRVKVTSSHPLLYGGAYYSDLDYSDDEEPASSVSIVP